MDTIGKFVLGAMAGALTLGAAAGIYCNFFRDDEGASDSFAELERPEANDQVEIAVNDLQPA